MNKKLATALLTVASKNYWIAKVNSWFLQSIHIF